MPSLHSRLRRQYPYLTPTFAGESDEFITAENGMKIPLARPRDYGALGGAEKDPREESLLRTMRDSIKRPDELLTTPADINPNISMRPPATPSVFSDERKREMEQSMMPDVSKVGPIAQPMPRIHLGVSTKGLQGVDKSIAELQAARDYDKQGLGFKVTPEGVDMKPPDPHIDWKDRLKGFGKTALISMANIKRANPDASATELLTGGAVGGGIGAISPNIGNAMFRQAQIADMEQKLGPQIKLAQEQAQLGKMQQPDKPDYIPRNVAEGEYGLPEGTEIRQQINPKTGQAEDVIVNGQPVVVNRPRKVPERTVRPIFRDRKNKDGSVTVMRSDDNGKTFTEDKSLGSEAPAPRGNEGETPQQLRSRQGQFRAAQKEFNDLVEAEKRAAKKKDEAYAKASTLRDWYNNPAREAVVDEKTGQVTSPAVAGRAPAEQQPNWEDVVAAEKAAQEAQNAYESYAEKKSAAEARMLQYGDVDEKGAPREPRGKDPQIQAYADEFFKGDYAAAEAAIKKQRGQ